VPEGGERGTEGDAVSYDVTFGYPGPRHLNTYPDDTDRNYTSNVSQMWAKALGDDLGDLINRLGERNGALTPILRAGVEAMEADPGAYQTMEPENGWGTYEGALAYLRWMLAMCDAVPEGWVEVWR
jgi:hypothetical protein